MSDLVEKLRAMPCFVVACESLRRDAATKIETLLGTHTSELVNELRNYKKQAPWSPCGRAADRIETLLTEGKILREALFKIASPMDPITMGEVQGLAHEAIDAADSAQPGPKHE